LPKKPFVKELRSVIATKLGIKKAQIYAKARILAVKTQTKTEDGIFLLAAQNGINLNKYLPQDKLNQIRQLLFQLNQHGQQSQPTKLSTKNTPKTINVSIGKTITFKDPLLTEKLLKEAKQMAEEVYPLLYIFENSVREMIIRIMQKVHGSNWWHTEVSKEIRDEVQKRKYKEDQNPWHGKRGAHPVYYTDLEHLGRIVQNNWGDFKLIIPTLQWLTQRVQEVGHSRNPVAHMNPLGKDDIQRIKVYFRDWQKLIIAKKNLIP
jgi:hypothetical protein